MYSGDKEVLASLVRQLQNLPSSRDEGTSISIAPADILTTMSCAPDPVPATVDDATLRTTAVCWTVQPMQARRQR